MYNRALELSNIKNADTALDLYCGTGTITLLLAKRCKKAIGIEINKHAVKNAKHNAQLNSIKNAEFICEDAAIASKKIVESDQKIDVVCVDPPRKGLSNDAINTLQVLSPKKIIYISCNAATLARDLAILCNKTHRENNKDTNTCSESLACYSVEAIEAVDMFPRTYHVEAICILNRRPK